MAQEQAYIRQGSLDRHPRDWWQQTEAILDRLDRSAPIKPIPVFHERSGFPDRRFRGSDAKTVQNPFVDAEDILFNKRSGVTRIPAARLRRHSVQLGHSGSYYSPDSRGAPSGYQNRPPGCSSDDEFPDRGSGTLQAVGRSGDALGVSSLVRNDGVQTTRHHHTSPDPERYRGAATSGKPFSKVPVAIADDIRDIKDCAPIDLTPVQSDTSSHIICHKPSGSGRSGTTRHGQPYEMGVVRTVDQSGPLAAADGANDDGATYRRQLSSSNVVTLTNGGRSERSDVTPAYVKRNIHVRRHSVSAPSALRLAPKPKLLQDFQDWTSHSEAGASASEAKSPEATSNECGVLVPVRRYSVTYAPEAGAPSDEASGESRQQMAPSATVEKVKNRKRSARRRCRPLSIVNEGTLPPEVDGEEFDSGVVTDESVNDSTTTTTSTKAAYGIGDGGKAVATAAAAAAVAASENPTAVSIEREDGSVNIVAAGDVNICLGTDKPFSVIDRSGSYDVSRLDPWTGAPTSVLERSAAGDGHSPVGMWRQGNVLVDSVGSAQRAPMYQLPYGAQQLPMVQPIPMIYHPYLNPELRGGFGYQGSSVSSSSAPSIGQKKSIYSPLSVDTSDQQAQPTFLPFPVPRPVFRFAPAPSGGLLRTAASRRGPVSANTAATRNAFLEGKDKNHEDEAATAGSHRSATESGHVSDDVVNRADDESPPPQVDVKEMIADFESKLDTKAAVPEFGTAFGDVKGSSSRRASGDLQPPADGRYRLQVEGDNNWQVSQSPTEAEPTTLRAYIAEMSISERKYEDNQTVTSPT